MTGIRFLVVDDNQDVADTLSKLLTLKGHDCRVAYGSHHAIAIAALFRPEIRPHTGLSRSERAALPIGPLTAARLAAHTSSVQG